MFGNSAVRSQANKNLVEFKAGKMNMKGKMVHPDNRKGLLYIYQSDDSLMHFCWKDRSSNTVEDDLIIFPDECEFKSVPQCKTGRVYILNFKSSTRKLFFWLQDLNTTKDEDNCKKVNDLLNNPPSPGSQVSSGTTPEGDLQNLLNNMNQQQLMQLLATSGGQIPDLGSLLGRINRSSTGGNRNTRSSNSSSSLAAPVAVRSPSTFTPSPASTETAPAAGSKGATAAAATTEGADKTADASQKESQAKAPAADATGATAADNQEQTKTPEKKPSSKSDSNKKKDNSDDNEDMELN